MKSKILVDANSIGYAASQSSAKLKSGDQPTSAIYGTLQAIRDLRLRRREAAILVLWDGRSWRYNVYPEYKGKRSVTPQQQAMKAEYKAQTPYIRKALKMLGVTQVYALNLEADDLGAILSQRFIDKGESVRLVTADRDWLQMVRPGVVWEDHRSGERVSVETFKEFTGYETVHQFCQSKCLQGDSSDNIPGVGMIGEKKAELLLKTWGGVGIFFADNDPEATWKASNTGAFPKAMRDFHTMKERHQTYFFNFGLMQLVEPEALPKPENLTIHKSEPDFVAFRELCGELAFHSILRDFDQWVEPFTSAKEIQNAA